ncbi:MAG: MFS transporter [Deltaproteobacteria bacterium]|nr:MFS transporter [Deltaproteobacteria bacterium]
MTERSKKIRWWAAGDVSAFFGLMLDNVTNLVLLAGILIGTYGFPADIIATRMIPGTALGVLVGDLVYTWLAVRLARRTGRSDVTAMPLGLDTPSTIGMAFAVIGPTYVASGSGETAWQVGCATLVIMGVVKVILSFCGGWIRRVVPDAGLLGSLGGVGIALLAFLPLVEIFRLPVVGMVSLGIILYTLVARIKLPARLPGAFAAILAGTAVYYAMGGAGLLGEAFRTPEVHAGLSPALPTLAWLRGMPMAVAYLPIAVPFGLLTIVGGINVTQSARLAGDDYRTRDILLTEAVATLVAGVFGGVAQSTPYIGHPAYKAMGGRAGYTLATGLFIGIGGMLGMVSAIVDLIPVAAIVPILVFVGLEIVSQSYRATPGSHAPAVTLAFLPSVGYLVLIYFDQFAGFLAASKLALPADLGQTYSIMQVLGHGFIVTAMIWGGAAAYLLDRKLARAGAFLLAASVLSLFGVIHSVMPHGEMYLPWRCGSTVPVTISAAYALTAALLAAVHRASRP